MFERPSENRKEVAEIFKRGLQEKAESSLRELIAKKVEEYFRSHISERDLNDAASLIFHSVLEGKADEEIAEDVRDIARDVVNRSLSSTKEQNL